MDSQDLSKEAKQQLNEAKARGVAFDGMIRSKGWEFVKAYYQNKVQTLASGLLVQDDKPISDFENERRELIGLRKLLGMIESDIETLKKKVKK